MNSDKMRSCITVLIIAAAIFAISGFGPVDSYAAEKKPGQVKGFKAPVKEQYVNEIISLSDSYNMPLNVEREVWLYWKKVKAADGYRVYMSTVGPGKGFKLKETIDFNYGDKGIITCPLRYTGFKKTEVWVKVRAYKRSGNRPVLGKPSKTIKITVLYNPVIKSIKPNKDKTGLVVKWTAVDKAKHYEVSIAKSEDMWDWTDEYNKKNEKKNGFKLAQDTPKAFFAVAKKAAVTQKTSCTIIPDEKGCDYCIHVRAVRGKTKSSEYGWKKYYWD